MSLGRNAGNAVGSRWLKRGLAALAIVTAAICAHPQLVVAQTTTAPCRTQAFGTVTYTVCTFDLTANDMRFFWRRSTDGTPIRTFGGLAQEVAGMQLELAFAINGGMFEQDLSPLGLFVQNGQAQRPLNTANAPRGANPIPNFYKKPGGVFLIAAGKARVITTDSYRKTPPKGIQFATQSGPMLVINGKINPEFIAGSKELKRRSGVGASDATHVSFAISDGPVSFYDFARLFRDQLGCANALFLDGGLAPGIYVPGLGRNDPPGDGGYGPIIAVVRTPIS